MRATTIDLYFVLIREIVRGIKARIECGNETPIMRRILRTIVRSNERLIEVTQEIKSYTPPPLSSTEDVIVSENSNFSIKPKSSTGRHDRIQQEFTLKFLNPWSSNGGRVRTLQERTSQTPPPSSKEDDSEYEN